MISAPTQGIPEEKGMHEWKGNVVTEIPHDVMNNTSRVGKCA